MARAPASAARTLWWCSALGEEEEEEDEDEEEEEEEARSGPRGARKDATGGTATRTRPLIWSTSGRMV